MDVPVEVEVEMDGDVDEVEVSLSSCMSDDSRPCRGSSSSSS